MNLAAQKCVPCEGGMPPLAREEAETLMEGVPGWTLLPDGSALTRAYTFKDFKTALAFADRIGEIAEREGHHPDLVVGWGNVGVSLTTHAIKGLSVNDFILAAKIDAIA